MIKTGTDQLLAEMEGHVLTLTLNRPEARNAFGNELKEGLQTAFKAAEEDPNVRCVILTGAGKAFCAGGDVGTMGAGSKREKMGVDAQIAMIQHQQSKIVLRIYQMKKPVIAALNGAAAGAGMSLALACDMRIASERAFLLSAFGNIGLSGDYGGTWFMTQLIGPAKTREIYYTSRRVLADEALSLGLFDKLVPEADLLKTAQETAQAIAQGAPYAIQTMKANIARAMQFDLATCLDQEAHAMVLGMQTQDHKDAVVAFREKRKPEFKGK